MTTPPPSSRDVPSLEVTGARQGGRANFSSTARTVGHGFLSSLLLMAMAGCAAEKCVNGEPPASPATVTVTPAPAQPTEPVAGPACGDAVCAPGTECCNASCGLCVHPGTPCTTVPCEGNTPAPAPGAGQSPPSLERSCAEVHCAAGMHCELIHVPCARAPCNPVPECLPGAAGGAQASPPL